MLSNLSSSNLVNRLLGAPDFMAGLELGQLVIRGGLGIVGTSEESATKDLGEEFTSELKEEESLTLTNVAVGLLYYLAPPQAEHVAPYITVNVQKTFADFGESGADEESQEYSEELASPLALGLAGGFEYYINPYWSVGVEVGLHYTTASAERDTQKDEDGFISPGREASASIWNVFYSGVTVGFHIPL